MDCRCMLLLCVAVLFVLLCGSEGRMKKVVIHVPYKVKKIKHTHTVYKTIHHHHTHHDDIIEHGAPEEHEHFHHVHDVPLAQHTQPVPGIGIPEFLPDAPIELPIDIPDVPEIPNRLIPLFRRA